MNKTREICDDNIVNHEFISGEDADYWFDIAMKPYRQKLKAHVREAEDLQMQKLQKQNIMKIRFGDYRWRVLVVESDKMLLLSEKIVEQRKYHHSYEDTTWAECELRGYLNGVFYNTFNSQDRDRIIETEIMTSDNPWYKTRGGCATNDRIFLLSIEEAVYYLGDCGQLKNQPENEFGIYDQYNYARIAYEIDGGVWNWWLRSPGIFSINAAGVDCDGGLDIDGYSVSYISGGVRPALWLQL